VDAGLTTDPPVKRWLSIGPTGEPLSELHTEAVRHLADLLSNGATRFKNETRTHAS
jgi:hypothetical protein